MASVTNNEGWSREMTLAWPPRPHAPQTTQQLQLQHRPQIVPDIRDRLDRDALINRLHLLRPELRNPDPDRELLPLRAERDGRASGQRRVRGREPPTCGRQAGTHHVCAAEEEADRAAVDAHAWEDERICERPVGGTRSAYSIK